MNPDKKFVWKPRIRLYQKMTVLVWGLWLLVVKQ